MTAITAAGRSITRASFTARHRNKWSRLPVACFMAGATWLLVIDPDLVTAEIRREDGGNGNFYPHIYGPLNVNAVTAVVAFEPNPDGGFVLPARLYR
jgi:uncharacterized protein (DUF952 family)